MYLCTIKLTSPKFSTAHSNRKFEGIQNATGNVYFEIRGRSVTRNTVSF